MRHLGAEVDVETITIILPDEHFAKLRETATHLKVSPEELVQASVEDLLTRPEEAFRRAGGYVLEKNADLYRRLA
jgi:hypothetical protein